MSSEQIQWPLSSESGSAKKRRGWVLVLALGALLMTIFSVRFDSAVNADTKPSITIDQCSNLTTTCDTAHPANWQNGNLGTSNSDYAEGDSVAYRSVVSNLTIGQTYFVDIEWDTTEAGGHHAIDYLTSFDRTETTADPCSDVTCSGSPSHLAIPIDSRVTAAGVTQLPSQRITAYGATFPASGATVANTGNLCGTATCTIAANPAAYGFNGTYTAASQTSTRVFFTATSATAVLAWGGHIASRQDWGSGNSATALSGSPYHMRVLDFGCSNFANCSSGNMDRSLSAGAVILPASITIVKQASVEGSTSFPFTASPAPLSNFSLVDDGTDANTRSFSGITNFTTYTISESSVTLWDLDRVSCSVNHANGGTQDVSGARATLTVKEGEDWTCTWYNTSLASPSISLAKSANPTTYSNVGDVITYNYVITNTGNTTLGPAQFKVDDDRIDAGVAFNCGPANTTLTVSATVSCSRTYSITSSDITNKSVMNSAFATGAEQTSQTVTATVTYSPPVTTTTTTAPPTTTTTLPTTTTVAPTTTAAPTTTLAVLATTTIPGELQVINPDGNSGVDGTYDVLYPEDLPATGWNNRFVGISGLLIMFIGIGLLVMAGTRRRKPRGQ